MPGMRCEGRRPERWGMEGREGERQGLCPCRAQDIVGTYLFTYLEDQKAGIVFSLPTPLDPLSRPMPRPWEMLKKCKFHWIGCWKIASLAMVVLPIIVAVSAGNRRKSYSSCCSVWQAVLVLSGCRIPARPSKPAGKSDFLTCPPLWFPAWLGHPATYQLNLYGEKGESHNTRFTALKLLLLPLNCEFLANGLSWCLSLLWCLLGRTIPCWPFSASPSLLGFQTGWRLVSGLIICTTTS